MTRPAASCDSDKQTGSLFRARMSDNRAPRAIFGVASVRVRVGVMAGREGMLAPMEFVARERHFSVLGLEN